MNQAPNFGMPAELEARFAPIRFDKNTMRAVEAGPDGVEYLAFGAGDDPRDAEMVQSWWSD
ncbi:MAG TPA: hypothetical protein VEL10_06385 [Gaiellaceae bacterium]|nr:hypothetical protein [Gaiellaceae bacterium]